MRKNKPPQERQFPRHSHSIPRHSTGGRQSTAPPASGGSMEGRKRTDSVPARRGRPVTGPLFSARPPGPASEAPAHHRARFHHLQEAEIILSPLLSYFNGSIPCPPRPVKPRPAKRRGKKARPWTEPEPCRGWRKTSLDGHSAGSGDRAVRPNGIVHVQGIDRNGNRDLIAGSKGLMAVVDPLQIAARTVCPNRIGLYNCQARKNPCSSHTYAQQKRF